MFLCEMYSSNRYDSMQRIYISMCVAKHVWFNIGL